MRVSGRLLRYPVATVRLSGSLKALPVYRRESWRLGLSYSAGPVLAGASRLFNKVNKSMTHFLMDQFG